MASGYPGLGASWRFDGGAGWGNARAEGGIRDRERRGPADGPRRGAPYHHVVVDVRLRAGEEARGSGEGGSGSGWPSGVARSPRVTNNEQRTRSRARSLGRGVARARRTVTCASSAAVMTSSGGTGASDVGIAAFERSRTPIPSAALATDSQATDAGHRARRGGRLREWPESPSSDPRVGASIGRLESDTRDVPAHARTSGGDPRGRPGAVARRRFARGEKEHPRGREATNRRTSLVRFSLTVCPLARFRIERPTRVGNRPDDKISHHRARREIFRAPKRVSLRGCCSILAR